ncbi:hypothetical protein AYI69_g7215 [Smittium culicis]|uniref:Uncharacterized protein n=1 Tax=Smittium culicis TaxID=133412 RepID=A0A1R1XTP3_9FUNG|nr:hypothetical protein AYI69_g7215 [Smittium culicis]
MYNYGECKARMVHDYIKRITYYVFDNVEDSDKVLNAEIDDLGNKIKMFRTASVESDMVIASIPNFRDIGVVNLVKLLYSELSPLVTILDISAWRSNETYEFVPYKMRLMLKLKNTPTEKTNITSLPTSILSDHGEIKITYSECISTCEFCKKSKHRRSVCPDITSSFSNGNLSTLHSFYY